MNPMSIILLVQALTAAAQTEKEVVAAWNLVSKLVAEDRDPTAAEWAAANLDADEAHTAVHAMSAA